MDTELIDAVMVPVLAAVGAMGHKVLTTVEDETADEAVRLGWRLLARLRRGRDGTGRPQLEAAAADATADLAEEDFRSALRGQVKKALAGTDGVDDPELAADLTGILAADGVSVTAIGVGAVAVNRNDGIISTGGGATITQHRR